MHPRRMFLNRLYGDDLQPLAIDFARAGVRHDGVRQANSNVGNPVRGNAGPYARPGIVECQLQHIDGFGIERCRLKQLPRFHPLGPPSGGPAPQSRGYCELSGTCYDKQCTKSYAHSHHKSMERQPSYAAVHVRLVGNASVTSTSSPVSVEADKSLPRLIFAATASLMSAAFSGANRASPLAAFLAPHYAPARNPGAQVA